MYSEKDLEKFRSIKAPESLKDEIEKSFAEKEQKRSISLKPILALAACFAVVSSFLIFFSLSGSKPTLIYQGTVVKNEECLINEASSLSLARTSSVSGIPFEIDVKSETTISVSKGALLKEGETSEKERILIAEKGKTIVYLTSFDIYDLPLSITLETEKGTYLYILEYDEAKGFYIYKGAENKN